MRLPKAMSHLETIINLSWARTLIEGLGRAMMRLNTGVISMGEFSLPHILIVLVIVLVFFGPSRLPGLGKSLGEAIRGFKQGISPDEGSNHQHQAQHQQNLQAPPRPPVLPQPGAPQTDVTSHTTSSGEGDKRG